MPAPSTGTTFQGLPLASGYTLSVRALNAVGQGPVSAASAPFELECQDAGFPGLSLTSVLDATALLVHDLNADGRADVILAARERADAPVIQVRQGAGRGRLQGPVNHPLPAMADRLMLGDLNGDGRQDVVAGSASSPVVAALLSQQGGALAAAVTTDAGAGLRAFALGEFTGDGRADLVVSPANSSGQLWVLAGRGDGTFQAPITSTATVGANLGVGDFNRDGKADVVFSGASRINVLLGDGTGRVATTGTTYSAGSTDAPLAVGDFNADGAPDVAVLNSDQRTVDVLLNNGNATFKTVVRYSVGSVAATWLTLGDIDRDGAPDLTLTNSGSASFAVLRGRVNGTFEAIAPYAGMVGLTRHAVGDIDGDGSSDVAMIRASASSSSATDALDVAWGRADGTLDRPALVHGPEALFAAVGDIDLDGRLDVVSGRSTPAVTVWKGSGNGTLTAAPALTNAANVTALSLNDLNADGRADVVVGNGTASTVSVFLAQANGTFGARVDYATGGFVFDGAIGVGDINGDGLKDLAVPTVVSGAFRISVLLGAAGGTFLPVTLFDAGSIVSRVVLADVNADGRADVIGSDANSTTVVVKLGRADGALEASQLIPVGGLARSLTVGDFDGSGRPDLAVSDLTGLYVYLNNGAGAFGAALTSPVAVGLLGRVAGDVNGDGRLDLATYTGTATNGGGRMWILLGLGDGTFATTGDTYPSSTTDSSSSLLLGDMNGDGRADFVGSNRQHGVFVLPQACF